ncbi:hypothetical protein IFR04_013244 [Cadophora malorum]|uniref:IgE-binding protein n=1 Tax=Cadophora malorum TaxID=108018 RepID=A0A8H7W3C4_9HELO|nr:hypothetical protein IFR04_013244 [Cadophora malorum]
MYTKAALISALAGLAIAAPAPVATYPSTADPNTFTIIASHSLSPVQGAGVSANGGSFYLNKGSGTYCPSPPVDCSYYNTTATVFGYTTTTQTLFMGAVVPGGQRVFVRSDGSLGFTQAHSAALPDDAYTSPFEYTPQTSEGSTGTLTFEGKSFSACPDGTFGPSGRAVYKLYADAVKPEERAEDCIGVGFATAIYTGPIPYEYV